MEGNDGVRGEIAVLTTPNVTTGVGQSLGFYYHIITENDFTFIQSEGLSVIAQLPDGRSQLLWWQNQTSSYEWLYGCVNLPDNTHLNIQFVTKRIGLDNQNNVFDADVAVDDIALLLLPCSGGKISIISLLIYLFHFFFTILLLLKFSNSVDFCMIHFAQISFPYQLNSSNLLNKCPVFQVIFQ